MHTHFSLHSWRLSSKEVFLHPLHAASCCGLQASAPAICHEQYLIYYNMALTLSYYSKHSPMSHDPSTGKKWRKKRKEKRLTHLSVFCFCTRGSGVYLLSGLTVLQKLQLLCVLAIWLLSKLSASWDVQWPRSNLHIWGIPVIYSIDAIKLKDVSRVPTCFEPKQPFWSPLSGCIHIVRPYLNRFQLFLNSRSITKRELRSSSNHCGISDELRRVALGMCVVTLPPHGRNQVKASQVHSSGLCVHNPTHSGVSTIFLSAPAGKHRRRDLWKRLFLFWPSAFFLCSHSRQGFQLVHRGVPPASSSM